MLFVIICIDRPGGLPIRMATREVHLAYVKETTLVNLRVGGPFLDEGAMVGSMLIVEADDPAKVAEFVKNDPYGKAGLFESVAVRPWKATVGTL